MSVCIPSAIEIGNQGGADTSVLRALAAAIPQGAVPSSHQAHNLHPVHPPRPRGSTRPIRRRNVGRRRSSQISPTGSVDCDPDLSHLGCGREAIILNERRRCQEGVLHSVVAALEGRRTLVLSFRAIQLHRIEMIQHKLVALQSSMASKLKKTGTISEEDWEKLDKGLDHYGRLYLDLEAMCC
jgi:hypothetical protein